MSYADAGYLLYWNFGKGVAGSYSPNINDAEYAAPGVSISLDTIPWTRDGNGNAIAGTNFGWLLFDLPAKTTSLRRTIIEYAFNSGVDEFPERFEYFMNYQDGNNHWFFRTICSSGADRYDVEIYEVTAGAVTNFATTPISLPQTPRKTFRPVHFTSIVEDKGDILQIATSGYEITGNRFGVADIHDQETGRTFKNNTTQGIRIVDSTSGMLYVRSIRILDIPNYLPLTPTPTPTVTPTPTPTPSG